MKYFGKCQSVLLVLGLAATVNGLITCRNIKGVNIKPEQSLEKEKKWTMQLTSSVYDSDINFSYVPYKKNQHDIGLLTRNNMSEIAQIQTWVLGVDGLMVLYDLDQRAGEIIKILNFKTCKPRRFCYIVCDGINPDVVTVVRCYGGKNAKFEDMKKSVAKSQLDTGKLKIMKTDVQK